MNEEALGFCNEYIQEMKSTRRTMWDDKEDLTMNEEALGFCNEYIQEMKSTRRTMWDDKEDLTMNDEILEGNGHPRRLSVDLKA
jgi:hypothetical protein